MPESYPTPHIDATPDDFAPTVLMPGDPLRAKMIAENYLEDAKLVNNVRGISGYTGTYEGKRVSVMASGMGMPSIGIYSYELFNFFGVENIIRIGSAGGIDRNIHVRDIVVGMGCSTDSAYASNYNLPGTFAPICSYSLLKTFVELAEKAKVKYHVGNLLSSDIFYQDDPSSAVKWSKMGIMAVEMEGAALYMNAARAGKNALTVCTVSDHVITGESLSSSERQNTFNEMITLALLTAVSI